MKENNTNIQIITYEPNKYLSLFGIFLIVSRNFNFSSVFSCLNFNKYKGIMLVKNSIIAIIVNNFKLIKSSIIDPHYAETITPTWFIILMIEYVVEIFSFFITLR